MSDAAGAVKTQLISWLRQGLAASVATPAESGSSRVSINVAAQVRGRDQKEIYAGGDADKAPAARVRLYGPGDVTGLDPRQIVRAEPPHGTVNFEPNYFPLVEFQRPDLPWMFSPFSHDEKMRLRPWLCLVAVEKRPGVSIGVDPDKPLPVLKIEDPAGELPDLQESWWWAHAQMATSSDSELTPEAVKATLAESPEMVVSRLICPRRLSPNTAYYACLVPTFEAGRLAGVGREAADDLRPAWDSAATTTVELPVYYQWEFSTTTSGSFESLVRRLKPRPLPQVGFRDMTVSVPVGDEDDGSPESVFTVGFEGALISPDATPAAWSDEAGAQFEDNLKNLWGWQETGADALVAPPVYGSMHAPTDDATAYEFPVWLWELNLDPRLRAAAGLGALVVQQDQEQLMASAWEQAGDVRGVNRALRQGQLAREVNRRLLRKHFAPASFGSLLQLTRPVHTFLHLRGWVARSPALRAATGPAFRRLARRRAFVGRKVFAGPAENSGTLAARIKDNLLKSPSTFLRLTPPDGSVLLNAVTRSLAPKAPFLVYRSFLLADVVEASGWKTLAESQRGNKKHHWPEPPHTNPLAKGSPQPPPRALGEENTARMNQNFKRAVVQHQFYLRRTAQLARRPAAESVAPLNSRQEHPLDKLRPEQTVLERVKARLRLPPEVARRARERRDPLAPLATAPTFPYAMCEPLKEVARELFAPGLEGVPPDTLGLLVPNRRFIEAYMLGLNHEMGREMLWREYPAERDETYFQYFWTTPRRPELPSAEELKDILPVSKWDERHALGQNGPADSAAQAASLVLLVRGEVLRRYPTASVYAVRAEWSEDKSERVPTGEPLYPCFQGRLEPDITYLGFALDVYDARGSTKPCDKRPGWFFVFQEQPVEPRFGLDASGSAGSKSSWADLSWADATAKQGEGITHLRLSPPLGVSEPEGVGWGDNSAQMAFITARPAARVAVHADTMLLAEG